MVVFVGDVKPEWASDNLDILLGTPIGGDALWVVDPDFRQLYCIDVDSGRPPPPFADEAAAKAAVGDRYNFSWFVVRDGAVWQVFGSAIQDPKFWRHETPVLGYLLHAKRWDDVWFARLGDLTQLRLQLYPTEEPPTPDAHLFLHPLRGLTGEPVAWVRGSPETIHYATLATTWSHQRLILLGGFVLLTAIALGAVTLLVTRPLGHILRSLEARNPAPLGTLVHDRSPIGEIARLLASLFRQGRMLQEELRRQQALQDPELAAREAAAASDLRLQLARDLHDGPLQTIYAAGLHLETLRKRLETGQAVPPDELEGVQEQLSSCSANLRNLLFELEPEELRDHELVAALERLERYLLSITPGFELDIEDGVLDGLSREAELHLFYICRELVSNATRHAKPVEARLAFSRRDGFLHLDWSNDGVKPKPPAPAQSDGAGSSGNGLRNIARRVTAMDGTCQHRLVKDQLWTVSIALPYTSLTVPSA